MSEHRENPCGWVGTVRIEVTNLESATQRVIAAALSDSDEPEIFRLTSARDIAEASKDLSYREILNGPGHNFPDGTPLVWVLRRQTKTSEHKPGVVRGPTLTRMVLDAGRERGVRHFFLGSTDATLARLRAAVERKYPGIQVAGSYSPPFAPLGDSFYQECAEQVSAAKPDLVWVGLGAPKQDFAAVELARRTGCTHVGVGAAFDFIAGTVAESPVWFHGTGLEWTYRFAAEPRRLWRRYLFGNSRFIRTVLLDTTKHSNADA